MQQPDLIVIGAGAAGLMAAGTAAASGRRVLLLEKMARPGRKLAITGKGRCNLTNVAPRAEFESHFGAGGAWLRPAFDAYFSDALMAFLESLGIPLVTERGGRVFPADKRATDVVKALVGWCRQAGVSIKTDQTVTGLLRAAEGRLAGVQTVDGPVQARSVVVATGGKSYPATGSTGDGYALAASVGHSIVPTHEMLVPLVTETAPGRELDGLMLKNVRVSLLIDGCESGVWFGEMGFTGSGVTGPLILSLSGTVVKALAARRQVELMIDLKPALGRTKLLNRLDRDLRARGQEPMKSILRGLMPKPMVGVCLQATGIRGRLAGSQLKPVQRERLMNWLKCWRLRIVDHRGMSEAIVTGGGVALDEVCPKTMTSGILPGLFFAGEVLDVQAGTGGYNLQAAFSTGVLAGRCAGMGGSSN